MTVSHEELYIDLLKKTLSYLLWPEPPVPFMTYNYRRPPVKRAACSALSRVLALKGYSLVQERLVTDENRIMGNVWPGLAHTMIGLKRLDNIGCAVRAVIEEGIEGDLIECGVWRGGACIFMRGVLAAYGVTDRRVFVADSFQGLPKADEAGYPSDKGDCFSKERFLSVSKDEVSRNFEKYGLLDDQVVFLEGWFKESLPTAPIDSLAVLRLDGDMYESTMDALNCLYPKLAIGGFCIVDDYVLKPCREAVTDYRSLHAISDEIRNIDSAGAFWRKGT